MNILVSLSRLVRLPISGIPFCTFSLCECYSVLRLNKAFCNGPHLLVVTPSSKQQSCSFHIYYSALVVH